MPIENSVSVTAGSTVVDGYLTQFVAAPGDTFILNGLSFVVERQETSARLILADPWPGEELTDQANWELVRTSPYWQSTVTVNSKITDLIQRLEAGLPFKPDAVGTLRIARPTTSRRKGSPSSAPTRTPSCSTSSTPQRMATGRLARPCAARMRPAWSSGWIR